MSDYHVVFETIEKGNGYTGIRTITSYQSKDQFDHRFSKNTQERVVAEGISTQQEAEVLVSLTPEICALTMAAEEMCDKNGNILTNRISSSLKKAIVLINLYRYTKQGRCSQPPLTFVEIGDECTEKNQLFCFITDRFKNENGSVGDLEMAYITLALRVHTIVFERKHFFKGLRNS